MSRLQIADPNYVFCKEEVKSPCHLFLSYPASKSLWFATCWGLKTEILVSNQPEDIIKWVLDPPNLPDGQQQQGQVSLLMAIILEEIWQARNISHLHNSTWDVLNSIHLIHNKVHEFSLVSSPLVPQSLVLVINNAHPLLWVRSKLTWMLQHQTPLPLSQ